MNKIDNPRVHSKSTAGRQPGDPCTIDRSFRVRLSQVSLVAF